MKLTKAHFSLCIAFAMVVGIVVFNEGFVSPPFVLKKQSAFVGSPLTLSKLDNHTTQTTDTEFMHMMAILQQERRDTLARACYNMKQECVGKVPLENAQFSDKYKFSACPVFKSGSSTFLRSMLEMEGVNQSPMLFGALMAEAKKRRISALKTPEKKQELWNDYLRVILVRNPFERFVSGYTDKLVPEGRGYSYIYKPISIKLQNKFKSMRNNPSDRVLSQEHATFEDFVNYLISTPDGGRDNHWKSYEWWCGPCEHGYDIIIKMETLRDDVKYLWELLGISEEHRKWFFPEVKPAVDRLETERYFEKIPKNLSKALYDISKRDFNMFGYPKPKWIC